MSEDKKITDLDTNREKDTKPEAQPDLKEAGVGAPARAGARKQMRRPMRRKSEGRPERPKEEFEQKMVDLARVTRVMAGGKRMKFRACMVIGDKKGRVGVGIAKGVDVAMAIQKSVAKAKKSIVHVSIVNGTIPHEVNIKVGSSRLMMKPGKKGSGIKAGGVMRIVFELAGVKDVVGKILGTNNKINNTKAAIMAFDMFIGQEDKKFMPNKINDVKSDKETKK